MLYNVAPLEFEKNFHGVLCQPKESKKWYVGIENTHKIAGYLWNNIYGSNIYSSIMIVIIYQKNKRNKNQEIRTIDQFELQNMFEY